MSILTDQEIARICNGWPGNAESRTRTQSSGAGAGLLAARRALRITIAGRA